MNELAMNSLVSIDDFVRGLRQFPEAAFRGTADIQDYLARTPVQPESLAPYLTWDAQHYTRNLVDRTEFYELLTICWESGQASSIHNHLDQNCWMAAPMGRLLVQNYRVKHEELKTGRCQLERSDQVHLDPAHPTVVNPNEPVHKVCNLREFAMRAVTLHVYSRPFDTCVVYSEDKGTCGIIPLHFNTEFGKPVG
jgi:predicted metal-dependent enzyme (double-stranded beta helix superfamily)